MEADLPVAAALLPESFNFSAIGYGCTSGATIIGEDRVEKAIQSVHSETQTTNPLTACKAALRALGLKRVVLLTPYHPAITKEMRDNLLDSGFEIRVTGSFFETDDFVVGRISSESILKSIEKIGASTECDGVFVSCTNLRVASVIEEAEARLGKPVTSSNHALAWHLRCLVLVTHDNACIDVTLISCDKFNCSTFAYWMPIYNILIIHYKNYKIL